MAKGIKRHDSELDIHMANKLMKRCSLLIALRGRNEISLPTYYKKIVTNEC